mgnify:CR=1 FL=1
MQDYYGDLVAKENQDWLTKRIYQNINDILIFFKLKLTNIKIILSNII